MYRQSPIPEPVIGDWRDTDDCPPAFAKQQKRRSYDILPPEVIREARSAYYGLITQIDYNLARVYSALEDLGLYHETLIIYTSDHGEFLGDHRAGGKSHFHEPSAHVPFAMRMPSSWDNRCHGTQVEIAGYACRHSAHAAEGGRVANHRLIRTAKTWSP